MNVVSNLRINGSIFAQKIIAFGDSVMRGVVTEALDCKSGATVHRKIGYKVSENSFVEICSRWLGIPIENRSRFGSTVLNGMDYVERYFNRIEAGDIVVLEFGGNDCNFDWKAISDDPDGSHQPKLPLDRFGEVYNSMIDRVAATGAVPVLLSLPELDPTRFFNHVSKGLNRDNIMRWLQGDVYNIANWHEQYNIEVFKIGASRGVKVIDISSVFLQQRRLGDYLCDDGMHPNEEGHRLIAEAIMSAVAV